MLHFLKIEPIGKMWMEEKMGLRVDPWGTPHVRKKTIPCGLQRNF